jgi:hydroxymethylpyrimidine kinase/phosphomethylpyrimidine kinase/thiamine-phosphate diphosphorylase
MGLIWNVGDGGREAGYAEALAARAFGVKFKPAARQGAVSALPRVLKAGPPASAVEAAELAQRIDSLRAHGPLAVVLDLGATFGQQEHEVRAAIEQQLLPRATVAITALRRADLLVGGLANAPGLAADLRSAGAGAAIVINAGAPDRPSTAASRPAPAAAGETLLSAPHRGVAATAAIRYPIIHGQHDAGVALAWMDTPQAQGWLRAAAHGAAAQPYHDAALHAAALAAALALDFCVADAAVLAHMAVAAAEPEPGFALDGALLPWLDRAPGMPAKASEGFAPLAHRQLGLYAVVGTADWAERVLAAGVSTVQLRAKEGTQEFLSREIARCVKAANAKGAQLFINDHWELALEHKAYGVHLGQEDLLTADLGVLRRAGIRIGISTHCYWEVCRALAIGPSYIACGPVYPTTTKDMPWIPQGPGNVAYWARTLEQPVVAIGGMDEARSCEAARCGAAGVAVVRGIVNAQDHAAAIAGLQRAIAEGAAGMPQPPDLPRSTLGWQD